MQPEPLTPHEWAELRALQAKPPAKRDAEDCRRLSDLVFQQMVYAMDLVVTDMMPLVKAIEAKHDHTEDVEALAAQYRPPEIPTEPTSAYAKLPNLIATVAASRSYIGAAARQRTKLASDSARAHDRLRRLWAANTPTAGPEWQIDAEFTVVAKPLVILRDTLETEAEYLKAAVDDLHQTSIALRAIKDLAQS